MRRQPLSRVRSFGRGQQHITSFIAKSEVGRNPCIYLYNCSMERRSIFRMSEF